MEPGVTSSMSLIFACPVRLFGFTPASHVADFGDVNKCLKNYLISVLLPDPREVAAYTNCSLISKQACLEIIWVEAIRLNIEHCGEVFIIEFDVTSQNLFTKPRKVSESSRINN
jgi:hypothetical protein